MKEIIKNAQCGDNHAKEQLYKLTADELSYFCSRLCGNRENAEDLVQETYLTAFEKLDQYRRDESLKGWLHTIALHKYYNNLRKEKPHLFADMEIDEAVEDELYGPENHAEFREIQNILMQAINQQLNEPQRITVLLYYYDNMSVTEISRQLDCPEGTVKTRLYHSRKILRDELIKKGISLTGSTVLISAALRSQAVGFTASAATAAAVTGALSKKAASNTLKSVLTYAKGKIIAGACVVAVAGGAAVYNAVKNDEPKENPAAQTSQTETVTAPRKLVTAVPGTKAPTTAAETEPPTERPTGISQPGGPLVEYEIVTSRIKISVPDNYTASHSMGFSTPEGMNNSISDRNTQNLREKHQYLGSLTHSSSLLFTPDDFSGDVIKIKAQKGDDAKTNSRDFAESQFENINITDYQEFMIPVDNTNSPESPAEKQADKVYFSGQEDGYDYTGTVVHFQHYVEEEYFVIFMDFSGIRQQEYQSVIDSIILSYYDNSWMDNYDIPDEYRH